MANDGQPWWRAGLFAALISVAIPVATFVQGWVQKSRELTLQKEQQLQQIRMSYMNLMVEGGVERVELLADFIADTEQDEGIRTWAEKQRDKAQKTVKALEERISRERALADAAAAERRAAATRAAHAEAEAKRLAQASAEQPRRERAEREAAEAQRSLAKAQAAASDSEAKVARSREALSGRPPPDVNGVVQMALPAASRRIMLQEPAVPGSHP